MKLPKLPAKKGGRKGINTPGGIAALYAAPVGAVTAAWACLAHAAAKPPRVWAGEGELRDKVVPRCSLLHEPYYPSPVALNTHIQNILGFVRGAFLNAKYSRQLVIAHDGGTLGLDWYQGCDAWEYGRSDLPILLVLHGINGGSHEGYCKWVCHCAVQQQGWRAVVLNYRGCNGLPLTSPRGYAATLTHDVYYAISSIKARFPDAPLFAVGYSLGGLFLTKYLAEADAGLHASATVQQPFEGSGIAAAAVVSSPICLFNSSTNLSAPWTSGYLYNMALAYKLREFMIHHQDSIRSNTVLNLDKAIREWTVGAMEDYGIPNTFGYKNRQEYYEAASSLTYIPHICTPTLFLVSEDDPFLGVLPDKECSANPNTVLAATSKGGHVAFLQGWWPMGQSYMDHAVIQFLKTTWEAQLSPSPRPAAASMKLHRDLQQQQGSQDEAEQHVLETDWESHARSTPWLDVSEKGGWLFSDLYTSAGGPANQSQPVKQQQQRKGSSGAPVQHVAVHTDFLPSGSGWLAQMPHKAVVFNALDMPAYPDLHSDATDPPLDSNTSDAVAQAAEAEDTEPNTTAAPETTNQQNDDAIVQLVEENGPRASDSLANSAANMTQGSSLTEPSATDSLPQLELSPVSMVPSGIVAMSKL